MSALINILVTLKYEVCKSSCSWSSKPKVRNIVWSVL